MDKLKTPFRCGLLCFFLIIALMPGCSFELISGQSIFSGTDKHTALLLIDIQNFYFPKGKIPLTNSDPASQKAKEILAFFRKHELPVIHVKHMPGNQSSTNTGNDPGWAIHTLVTPLPGEKVIQKHHVNCFRETDLLDFLRKRQIRKLVVCGMQTHMCLEAGVRAAADFGFSVKLIHDACASRDLVFGNTRIPADLVHASTLATLKSGYAKVLSAAEFIEEQHAADNPKN